MVSKVAVIALVLIVACPILLGYGMNLQEVTETDYKASGESTNYTPLLQNGSGYTYTHGEVYQMNTRAGWGSYADSNSLPIYNTISSVRSSFVLKEKFDVDWTDWNGTQSLN